jgi:hypothetical protein
MYQNDAISPYFFQTVLFCKNIFANRTISKKITLLALFSFFFLKLIMAAGSLHANYLLTNRLKIHSKNHYLRLNCQYFAFKKQ